MKVSYTKQASNICHFIVIIFQSLLPIHFQIIISAMRNIISRNPFSGKILQQIAFSSHEQITKQLQNARVGFEIQSHHETRQKITMIRDLITTVERRKQQISKLITQETGKPIIQSQFQVKKALGICRYYADHHQGLLSINVKTQAKKKTLVKCLPLGTVYCVLPSMYPLLLNFYKTIPQLVLGNTVLVRQAHNTLGTARMIEKIMKKVGFQSGQYQCIWNSYDQTQTILKDINVVGLNFTGSLKSGSKLAALAGKNLKKYQIQAGINNVLILLQDGSTELALENILKTGFFSSGQGICPKKILIHKSQMQKFQSMLIERMKLMKFGNPQLKQTNFGPIMSPSHYQSLKKSKTELQKSSRLIFERQEITSPFLSPCIFECSIKTSDLQINGPFFQLFGFQQQTDIKSIMDRFSNISSLYVFTKRKDNPILQDMPGGNIFLNTVNYYDPHVPLGGGSSSGYWKQGWQESIRSFANIKTHYIN